MRTFALFVGLCIVTAAVASPKKFIFVGWDTGDLAPYEIVANAERLKAAGCDGVGIYPRVRKPEGSLKTRRAYPMGAETVDGASLAWMIPDLRKIAATPWLRETMFRVPGTAKKRLRWDDDAAWARYAANMGVIAATAKEGGLRGLILDSEDYYNERQYFLAPDEGDFETVAKLARRRGREVWEAVFRAFPEAVLLTYQFLSIDREYKVAVDPVCEMRIRGDLWPMYCNGILDALPPGAKIVDGDESGYRYEAAKGDFWRNASHQLTGVLPLVAPKNRAKYRAQVSVSFGMYPDSYAYHPPTSGWCFGPVAGSRLLHFEENLAQAVRAADEYVWFWGEHRTFVNWKDLDVRHWWDEWWPNASSLDNALPGYSDMVRGVKDPVGYVKERLAAGGFGNLVSDESFWSWQAEEKDAPKGTFTRGPAQGRPDCRTMTGVRTGSCNFNIAAKRGEWYGVKVSAFGALSNAATGWQKGGSWVKGVEGVKLVWDPPAADGWRTGWALVRVPDGVDRIVLGLYVHQQPGEQTHLDGVTVVRLRETPRGADERTEMPEHIRKRKGK